MKLFVIYVCNFGTKSVLIAKRNAIAIDDIYHRVLQIFNFQKVEKSEKLWPERIVWAHAGRAISHNAKCSEASFNAAKITILARSANILQRSCKIVIFRAKHKNLKSRSHLCRRETTTCVFNSMRSINTHEDRNSDLRSTTCKHPQCGTQ